MNLYKRGKIWWIKFQVDGKVHRRSTGTTKYAEAAQWLKSIKISRKMPSFDEAVSVLKIIYRQPVEGMIAIGNIWSEYEKVARSVGKLQISAKTITDRRNCIRRFTKWMETEAASVETVENISGAIAVKYAESLSHAGLSTKTRANTIGHLSTVWKMLEKISSEIKNPWGNLTPADTDHKRLLAFSQEQEDAILKSAKEIGKDWWSVCIIARHTGLRYGDIATLKWHEIDFEHSVILRKPSKTERYDISLTLPIIEPIMDALKCASGFADRDDPNAWVFPLHGSLYGKRGREVQSVIRFREVLDRAGVEGDYTFHSWRHTAATRLASAGVDIETRKLILGHRTDYNAERYDHDGHLSQVKSAIEAAAKTPTS